MPGYSWVHCITNYHLIPLSLTSHVAAIAEFIEAGPDRTEITRQSFQGCARTLAAPGGGINRAFEGHYRRGRNATRHNSSRNSPHNVPCTLLISFESSVAAFRGPTVPRGKIPAEFVFLVAEEINLCWADGSKDEPEGG